MIAIVKTGGKQYLVRENSTIQVETLAGKAGDTVTFNEVLLMANESGQDMKLGNPVVQGTTVTGTIVKQGRYDKVQTVKFKAKVRYRRRLGHRQQYTAVKINKIG